MVLDISGSMPDGHFDAAKTAAAALFDGLRPQDKLRLYACGSKVRTVLEGGEDADTAKAAIEALRKGGSTLLYDAVETLLADAAAADGRVAAAFISDGADSGRSSVTAEQLKNDLAASGLAPAAFCVDSASADDADAVGVYRGIIEGASGSFAEFDAESIGPALASWAAQAQNVYDLQLTAASNLADGSEHSDYAEIKSFAQAALDGELTGVHLFWSEDIYTAVYTTNLLMRASDLLLTKPSELAFYPVPKLMLHRIGGHEAWGAIRAAELGDGTFECDSVPQTLQMLQLLQDERGMLAEMSRAILRQNSIGTYSGAYKVIRLAMGEEL